MSNPEPQDQSAIKRVEREHEELRAIIGAIHKNLAEPSPPATIVREHLAILCDKLECHFRTEEDDGFFSQITDQAPRLSDQADKLCDEHGTMLEEARAITNKAILGEWPNVQQAFHKFSKRLMHHESEEIEMLQKAYWEDIGPAD
jgi:hypothetical protein